MIGARAGRAGVWRRRLQRWSSKLSSPAVVPARVSIEQHVLPGSAAVLGGPGGVHRGRRGRRRSQGRPLNQHEHRCMFVRRAAVQPKFVLNTAVLTVMVLVTAAGLSGAAPIPSEPGAALAAPALSHNGNSSSYCSGGQVRRLLISDRNLRFTEETPSRLVISSARAVADTGDAVTVNNIEVAVTASAAEIERRPLAR